MPLTPVLPENKNTLDARIAANLKDNGTQFINAEKLRNTLTPIVNSTYGLKTIWAGHIYSSFASARFNYQFYENYYDPYYFPPVQDTSSIILNSQLNKYQVTNLGSGLRINSLADGSFTNVSATLLTTNTGNGIYGGGLTFDGTITAGSLSSLTVNNPGIGYVDGYLTNTLLQLNLGGIGGSITPKLKFNLQRTIWPGDNNGNTENGWWGSSNNVFIPNIANIFPMPPVGNFAIGAQLSYSDISGSTDTLAKSLSRISRAYSESTAAYTTGGNIGNNNKPGFYFAQYCQNNGSSSGSVDSGFGSLEIKVPIVYQPTVI